MGQRGPKKQNDAAPLVLKMPAELRRRIQRAAKSESVSESEWIRRAAQAALSRAPGGMPTGGGER